MFTSLFRVMFTWCYHYILFGFRFESHIQGKLSRGILLTESISFLCTDSLNKMGNVWLSQYTLHCLFCLEPTWMEEWNCLYFNSQIMVSCFLHLIHFPLISLKNQFDRLWAWSCKAQRMGGKKAKKADEIVKKLEKEEANEDREDGGEEGRRDQKAKFSCRLWHTFHLLAILFPFQFLMPKVTSLFGATLHANPAFPWDRDAKNSSGFCFFPCQTFQPPKHHRA